MLRSDPAFQRQDGIEVAASNHFRVSNPKSVWVRNSRLEALWWARLDSNQEPTDYESAALTVELRARLQDILQIRGSP